MSTDKNVEKGSGAVWGEVRLSLFGPDRSDLLPPQEAPKKPPFPEGSLPSRTCTDTCDTPVAPLEAPLQGGGLRCSGPGCSTGIAGRTGDRLGGPGTLSPLFRGTLPTLIALPAVPHVPLRFGLGLLLVELRSGGKGLGGLVSWE